MKNTDLTEDQLVDIVLNAAIGKQKEHRQHFMDVREYLKQNHQLLSTVAQDVILTMEDRDLVTIVDKDYLIRLTKFGKEVAAKGGWKEHLKRKSEDERKAKKIQDWEIQKTEYEAKLAKRNYLTYWLLLAFALIAALGGVASIISLIT